jgi:hypothetical protein
MNDEGALVSRPRGLPDPFAEYRSAAAEGWTEADAAELDVLVFELARGYDEHRKGCRACRQGDCPELVAWREHVEECKACQGDAPLTYGLPCERKREFIAHGNTCPRCNPCPSVRLAIELVFEWRQARELRSRAEWLRAERVRVEGAPA